MAQARRNSSPAHLMVALWLMALAIRFPASIQAVDNIQISGITLTATSGTLELQRITATSARLNDERTRILATDIQLRALTTDERTVTATAPKGIIAVSGGSKDESAAATEPSPEQVSDYVADFATQAVYGDVYLGGEGSERATANVGDDASITSSVIIWSEKFGRILVPDRFRQTARMPDGPEIVITGVILSINRDFTEWIYHSTPDDEPASMDLLPQSAPTSATPTTSPETEATNE